MDVSKVPPPTAVDQLAAVLDSPEVARLIRTLEYLQETGRRGYGPRAMIGLCFVKAMYALPTWSRTCRLVTEHDGLRRVLGCAPSQWAAYRFAKQLRTRDSAALGFLIRDVLAALKQQIPAMGETVAIDGSDLPAYANGHTKVEGMPERQSSDPNASWGHRSAVSTRAAGGFFGYKVHAAVDVATDLPLAWTVRSGRESEHNFARPLVNRLRKRGFDPSVVIADKGYDGDPLQRWLMDEGIAPVIALKETKAVKRGGAKLPCCEHGEWIFSGADYKRKATKWRCPTGVCTPASKWIRASRLHPLIPRESKRFKDLYRSRSAVEREFGRLKHEWSLLPLRVRGIGRVQLHADLTILARLACALAKARAATQTA